MTPRGIRESFWQLWHFILSPVKCKYLYQLALVISTTLRQGPGVLFRSGMDGA